MSHGPALQALRKRLLAELARLGVTDDDEPVVVAEYDTDDGIVTELRLKALLGDRTVTVTAEAVTVTVH